MSEAFINPQILRWAWSRFDLELEDLAKKLSVKSEKIIAWEKGVARPTFKQAQKLAKILCVPFGYLFLKEPPPEELPIPDLRTINDRRLKGYSINLKAVINDVMRKQDWYRDYLEEQEYPELDFIGKYNLNTPVPTVAQDITRILQLTVDDRKKAKNWEDFLRLLTERAENSGILVMQSGKVGDNTRRVLDVEEFRGFVICDSLAPVVFINGTDAKAAKIFTLVHELAHLWFKFSGVSDIDLNLRRDERKIQNALEIKCNEVAAEVLVPKERISILWDNNFDMLNNINRLSKYFKVSTIVVARRALDLKFINFEEFYKYYQIQKEQWKREKDRRKSGGGNYYKNIPVANSRRFVQAVLQSVYSQEMLLRDGARLLGIKISSLERFAKEVGFIQ